MRFGIRLGVALVAVFVVLVGASATHGSTPAVETPLPRYALEPGQRLTYDSTRVSHNKFYRYDSEGDWTAWVVRRNPDGSHRIILRAHSKQVSYSKRDESTRDMWDKVWYATVDVFDDGRYIHNPTVGNSMSPNVLFPRLPATKDEMRPGWSWTDDHFWSTYELKHDDSAGSGVIGFQGTQRMMTDELYDMHRARQIEFDPSVGVLARSVGSSQKGDGAERSNRGDLVFRNVEMIDLEEILALERDVDAFLAAKAAYEKDGKKAEHDLETLESNLDAARDRFVLATETLVHPDLVAQAAEIVEAHPKKINYHTSRATHRASLVGKPAPDFSLPDLHGETWSLEAQRGKVVILDFWYRTCTWCVRCMPQIKQLCADLAEEPFIFFGMNTDKDLDDALFVENAMGLAYPSLQAGDVVKDYGVRAFPTMIIIGPDGIVRDVHVGYSETLRDEIVEQVQGLLEDHVEAPAEPGDDSDPADVAQRFIDHLNAGRAVEAFALVGLMDDASAAYVEERRGEIDELATANGRDVTYIETYVQGDGAVVVVNEDRKDGRPAFDLDPIYLARVDNAWKIGPSKRAAAMLLSEEERGVFESFGDWFKQRKNERAAERTRDRYVAETAYKLEVIEQKRMTPQTLEFFFYTNAQGKAAALASALTDLGYSATADRAAHDASLFVVTGWTTPMTMDEETVVAWTEQMCDLGYVVDCAFDGWGTVPE